MQYLLSLIAGLFGLVGFLWVKKRSAEALLETLKTKEKVNDIEKGIVKDSGLLQVEEARRKQIEEDIKKAKDAKDNNLDSVSDFFNRK